MTVMKINVVGESGSGKTSLAATIDGAVVVAAEAGQAALQGTDDDGNPIFNGTIIQVEDEADLEKTLTWMVGRPSGIAKPNEAFGAALYAQVVAEKGGTFLEANGGVLPCVVIDSMTDISRRFMQRAERSPETLSKSGARDGFAVFGKAKNDVEWLLGTFFDLYPGEIVNLAIADKADDPVDGTKYFVKTDTKKAAGSVLEKGEATLYLGVGEVEEDGEVVQFRYLRTARPTPGRPGFGLPLKDRTGTLKEIEPPDLGVIRAKFATGKRIKPLQRGLPASLQ